MRRRLSLLVSLVILGFSAHSYAQNASGIVNSSRVIDWSKAGIPGGTPTSTAICTTLNPGATAAQINSAIAACPSGQVVFLSAGTYNLTSGIDFDNSSNVTLRGAGGDQTSLVFSGNVNCFGLSADVCFRNGDNSYAGGPAHSASWTAGYSKGTTQITLSSTSGLTVGNTLVLDQINDSSDSGGVYVCEAQGACASEGPAGAERSDRAQSQVVVVTGISGNTVSISPGLYMPNWRSSQSPGAWWANTTLTGSGIENLTLDHSKAGATAGILFFNAYKCWVKGVKSVDSARNHVWLFQSAHIVVRDSYFYGSQSAAQQSYGIEPYLTSDDLIENNIFQHVAAPITVNGSASGSVFGYNYSVDDYTTLSASSMSGSAWLHSAGVDNLLFEGNDGAGFFGDNIHGSHNFITLFRNHWLGWETGKSSQTWPLLIAPIGRYYNVVGNVLGKGGYHNTYQGSSDASIYDLGSSINGLAADVLVGNTVMRWSNYDVVTGGVRSLASEVPVAIAQFATAVPTAALPPSFYLSSEPGWWSSGAWPAIGPDVSGGSDTSGHVTAIPAAVCYAKSSKASNGVLTFNANSCYGSDLSGPSGANAPPPPTNLTATPH